MAWSGKRLPPSAEMEDKEGSIQSVTFQSVTLPPLGVRSGSGRGTMRTPMRCLRLFVFAFLVPCALIAVPLYQRRVTHAPRQLTLTATDMRSVHDGISNVWCQAQELTSEAPFKTYRARGPLPQRSRRVPVTLRHKLTLSDDVKEFWGFYLLRGSRISVSACARWPGTSLLIVQGWAALNDCVWVGQMDSLEEESSEEEEDDDDKEEDEALDPVRKRWREFIRRERLKTAQDAGLKTSAGRAQEPPAEADQSQDEQETDQSPEARNEVDQHPELRASTADSTGLRTETEQPTRMDVATHLPLEMNIEEDQVSNLLFEDDQHTKPVSTETEDRQPDVVGGTEALFLEPTPGRPARARPSAPAQQEQQRPAETARRRLLAGRLGEDAEPRGDKPGRAAPKPRLGPSSPPRHLEGPLTNEVIDREVALELDRRRRRREAPGSAGPPKGTTATGSRLIPLTYNGHRGRVNQTLAHKETSKSEMMSSFSSSEEALLNCAGVLVSQPLEASAACGLDGDASPAGLTVQVLGDDYYYLVFSSENEVTPVDVFFDVILDKSVYDLRGAETVCANSSRCEVALPFWSGDQVVVEYPVAADGAGEAVWSEHFTVRSSCQPRGWLVAVFVAAALFSLFVCAFC